MGTGLGVGTGLDSGSSTLDEDGNAMEWVGVRWELDGSGGLVWCGVVWGGMVYGNGNGNGMGRGGSEANPSVGAAPNCRAHALTVAMSLTH